MLYYICAHEGNPVEWLSLLKDVVLNMISGKRGGYEGRDVKGGECLSGSPFRTNCRTQRMIGDSIANK